MKKFRTKAQNSLMFGLASKAGVSHDDLRDWTAELTGGRTDHTSQLYYDEALEIINRLEKVVKPVATPRRTVNYRRKKTGVVEIITAKQKNFIALLLKERSISDAGYRSICFRMFKHQSEPRTTAEGAKIIEALKAMNERDAKKKNETKKEAA